MNVQQFAKRLDALTDEEMDAIIARMPEESRSFIREFEAKGRTSKAINRIND
jgi:hypothetical protein